MDMFACYGTCLSRSNLQFLQSAKDVVESSSSDELEIVFLHTDFRCKALEWNEDGDDNELEEDPIPKERAGEVEMHGTEFDEFEIKKKISEGVKLKKSENVYLGDVDLLAKSDIDMQLAESSTYDFFFAFLIRQYDLSNCGTN